MSPVQEQAKAFSSSISSAILDEMRFLGEVQSNPGARKSLNSELWHACAGPLVSLPQPGSLVYYFPQGHSEQVSASTRKISNSHIPNYPTLPSQLLCQIHNVTLHADRDTDEIYAQTTLQPVNSDGDVFPIPNLGHAISKQPNEFFCKNLTASDTSTHGGFSVPRRAAEKLFPQLDYTMQPPNQELIVRDLHDNVWTFRHIYRGQPKRHLLTTGWSLFVGTKRLKAGDSVLFIRDERSQLLVGVRRANRQQTSLPSSVLSTDSMHIGVLAAAAHAAATSKACPFEFIIPMTKHHKAVYAQVSVGMRFGMMFETEESTKRRNMGTIVGINDFDPLRWPNSKWRNVQVEWDEQGFGERPDRVSLWEIETPESLFVFPAPSLKRQCLPGFMVPGMDIGFGHVKPLSQALEFGTSIMHPTVPEVGSDHLMKLLLTPQSPSPDNQFRYHQSIYASILQKIGGNVSLPTFSPGRSSMMQQEAIATKNILSEAQTSRCSMELQVADVDNATEALVVKQEDQLVAETLLQKNSPEQSKNHKNENPGSNCDTLSSHEAVKESDIASEVRTEKVVISEKHMETSVGGSLNDDNLVSPIFMDQEQQLKGVEPPHSFNKDNLVNLSTPQSYHSPQRSCYQSFTGPSTEPGFLSSSNLSDPLLLLASDVAASPSADISSIVNPVKLNPFETFQFSSFSPSYVQEFFSGQGMSPVHESDLHKITKSCGMRDLSDKSINQSDTYGSQQFEASNENMISSSCVSSTILEGFSNTKNSSFCVHSEDLFSSLADSQLRSLQDIPEGSGGTSSDSMEINECSILNKSSMKQVSQQRLRTYTKVQKLGSVGRSIDVTRFKDYHELKSAIACMFGLQQQFDDSGSSEWKLVYVDYENDVLLVGDDPWEEFVKCVKCIRILSPSEVQQMSEEGLQLMNSYLPPSI